MRQSFFFIILLSMFILTANSQTYREFNKTIPLKSDGRLVIDTYKGSITIATYDKAQVEINVRVESEDSDPEIADQDIKDTEIEINSTEKQINIQTNYDRLNRNRHHDFWDWLVKIGENAFSLPSVHYTIKMPRTAELKIKDYKSESHIEGLKSHLTFNTYKGKLEVSNLQGGVDLETYKGDIHISFASLKNNSQFETYKGKITVDLPKETGFKLQTDFEKHVEFSSDFVTNQLGYSKKHHHYDYSGNFNGGGPTLKFSSHKGDIRLLSSKF